MDTDVQSTPYRELFNPWVVSTTPKEAAVKWVIFIPLKCAHIVLRGVEWKPQQESEKAEEPEEEQQHGSSFLRHTVGRGKVMPVEVILNF